MHYKYAKLEICDECRIPLMRNESHFFLPVDKRQGGPADCQICGRTKVFTSLIITDYRVTPREVDKTVPRSIEDGFALLAQEDSLEKDPVLS